MITETAIVVAVSGDQVTVEAAIKSTCNSCQAQSDCGTGAVSRALAPKKQLLTLRTPVPVNVGQSVTIGMPEAGVISASMMLYVVPLVAFLMSIGLFSWCFNAVGLTHELWSIPPAVFATFLSYVGMSSRLKRLESGRFQPVIIPPKLKV